MLLHKVFECELLLIHVSPHVVKYNIIVNQLKRMPV